MPFSTKSVAVSLSAALLVAASVITAPAAASAAAVTSLTSGSYQLALEDLGSGKLGIGIYKNGTELDAQTTPLELQVKNAAGGEDDYAGA